MTEYLSYRNQYTAEQTNGLVSILIGTSIMKKLNKKTGFLKSFFLCGKHDYLFLIYINRTGVTRGR